jgi:NAD(P)-dependent dehydrogenase (short-subunit alcohol dehydrogenase family)
MTLPASPLTGSTSPPLPALGPGCTAVITGAGSGFGLEACRRAAARGMAVVLADVQADALQAAAEEIAATGVPVLAQRCDVASAADMQALADAVQRRFGAPQFVFNNAGVAAGGLIWEHSARDWDWVLGVNLMGVAHGVRLFVPMMLAAAAADPAWRGHVVNTASMAGLLNAPNMGVYNVSKHAVVALSETLHQDLALVTDQVRAHVLCPYFVPTGIHQSHRNRPAGDAAPPTRSQLVAQAMSTQAVTRGRIGADEVVARVFEAMDAGRFYIYSHPEALDAVRVRLQDVVEGRNPTDPFAARPDIGQRLRAALREG